MHVFKVLCYDVSPQPMCACVTLTASDFPVAFPRVSSLYAFQFLSSSVSLLSVFICDAGVAAVQLTGSWNVVGVEMSKKLHLSYCKIFRGDVWFVGNYL